MSGIIIQDHVDTALTVEERSTLRSLEAIIERGKQTFIDVGSALMEIRERRLYRETHSTFEAYTQERWDFSSSRARQLIGAAQVVASLPESVTGVTPPTSEAHARPLAALAPEMRDRVWREVVATAPDGNITRDHVQRVVDVALGKSGRFDAELYYAVDPKSKIVYVPGYSTHTDLYFDGRTVNLGSISGRSLNEVRSYDAYTTVSMPEIPDTPAVLRDGYYVDPKGRRVYPMDRSDDRQYRVRGYRREIDARRWRSVQDQEIRTYEICQPLVWTDPVWIQQAHFQPGMSAFCPKCGTESWYLRDYARYLPHPDEPSWMCPAGHLTPDDQIQIQAVEPETPEVEPDEPESPDNREIEILEELRDAETVLLALCETPDLVTLALNRVNEFNAKYPWMKLDQITIQSVRTIQNALAAAHDLSERYSGVLAYFKFSPGWYYAVDQTAKLVYWQQDAEAETCEDLFPGCTAVLGSSLIEDREVYLKAGYRLVVELVDRQPLKSKK